MVHIIQHVWPSTSQVQMLIATFALYVVLIGLFGLAYYFLFVRKPERFFIVAELAQRQADNVIAETHEVLRVLAREIEAMEEVRTALASGEIVDTPATLPSGHRVVTDTSWIPDPQQPQSEGAARLHLSVLDQNGEILCRVEGPKDQELTQDYFLQWLDEMLHVWRSRYKRRESRVTRVSEKPTTSLNLLDFIYFSAITQTTVGYGDILPSSTAIRMLVLAQVLIGYVLLVVILNLILVGGATPSQVSEGVGTLAGSACLWGG